MDFFFSFFVVMLRTDIFIEEKMCVYYTLIEIFLHNKRKQIHFPFVYSLVKVTVTKRCRISSIVKNKIMLGTSCHGSTCNLYEHPIGLHFDEHDKLSKDQPSISS